MTGVERDGCKGREWEEWEERGGQMVEVEVERGEGEEHRHVQSRNPGKQRSNDEEHGGVEACLRAYLPSQAATKHSVGGYANGLPGLPRPLLEVLGEFVAGGNLDGHRLELCGDILRFLV
jgi:hypothetical protein